MKYLLIFLLLTTTCDAQRFLLSKEARGTSGGGGGGGIAVVDTISTSSTWQQNQTASFTTSSLSNGYMVLFTYGYQVVEPTSVVYGAQSMTLIGSYSYQDTRIYAYGLVAPGAGTATITVTNAASNARALNVATFSGVNQITPVGTVATGGVNWSPLTVSATTSSAVGEKVICGIAGTNAGGVTLTPSAGTVIVSRAGLAAGAISSKMLLQDGASSVTTTWTLGTSSTAAILTIPLKP